MGKKFKSTLHEALSFTECRQALERKKGPAVLSGCLDSQLIHMAVELTEENHLQFFVPHGFAHGFAVLSDEAVFQYKCDNYYAPQAEGAIAWDDPALGIDWRVPKENRILSEKDAHHPLLADAEIPFVYEEMVK